MTEHDPLDGADIGDTVTVTNTEEIWLGHLEAGDATGTDRISDMRVDDVEVVTNEHGDKHLAVTVESEITKRLPHRWDACQQPRTETEQREARRSVWKRRIGRVVPMAVTLGVSLAIASRMMDELAGDIVINGEPMAAPSMTSIALVFGLMLLIIVAMPYLPGGFGGRSP